MSDVPPPPADSYPPQAPPPPAYGQQPAYQQPAYGGQPAYYAPARPTNTLAIVAFVLSFFISVAGIICGHLALNQIKRTGEGGHALALAGTIIGYVVTGLYVLGFIAYIVFVIVVFSAVGVAGLSSNSYS